MKEGLINWAVHGSLRQTLFCSLTLMVTYGSLDLVWTVSFQTSSCSLKCKNPHVILAEHSLRQCMEYTGEVFDPGGSAAVLTVMSSGYS